MPKKTRKSKPPKKHKKAVKAAKSKPPRKKKKAVKTRRPKAKAVSRKKPAKKAKRAGKSARKKAKAPLEFPWRVPLSGEEFLGVAEDFFSHVGVIALTLLAPLNVGETLHVRGHTSDFQQVVSSLQIDHAAVTSAVKGDGVGVKIDQKARKGDYIYKVR